MNVLTGTLFPIEPVDTSVIQWWSIVWVLVTVTTSEIQGSVIDVDVSHVHEGGGDQSPEYSKRGKEVDCWSYSLMIVLGCPT
tara:strand:+ start:846 stop:1091 length:246 start_codon:yes stop_codon:yes gene_type:complete